MATDVILPALGMAQETGKILQWFKAEGESITQGEPLLEIETDKATAELEAPASGILARVAAAVGDEIPVGQVIAVILAPGEVMSAGEPVAQAPLGPPDSLGPTPPSVGPTRSPVSPPGAPGPLAASPARGAPSVRPPASPRARRLARERGVDLAAVAGSGPGGAVLAADIGRMPEVPATLSTAWRLMAERTTRTWTSTPHFFLLREVTASRLIAWRDTARKLTGGDVTYTDLLIRLTAAALRRHPHMNHRWEGGTIVRAQAVNVGVAVAIDDGLVVPVIPDADRLTLAEIMRRRGDLVARAREGRLRPEDLAGGTFTISNLGMYAVDTFNAILNGPQAAILAVGRIADRVVPVDGQPAVRPVLVLSLSCDHRVIDGARGARFLAHLADLIEEPASLIE